MAEISIPRTPSPVAHSSKGGFTSLTPPPTTQVNRFSSFNIVQENRIHNRRNGLNSGRVPTLEEARTFSAEECRDLVLELIPILGETRMALAHTQLQLNLLNIDTTEAAQRAEVEQEMLRREADILRAGSPVLRGRGSTYDEKSPLTHIQRQLEAALEAGHDLESDNYSLKHRLRQAKRVIKHLSGQKSQQAEEINLLRARIKQNRASIEANRFTNPNQSPRAFHSPTRTRTNRLIRSTTPAQNPLDALLMADQILSADPSSMPPTPTPHRISKPRQGHTRGVQSLSSLPSTPPRPRRMSAVDLLATPTNRIIYTSPNAAAYTAPAKQSQPPLRLREDRDGTISATDDEALTDDDTILASQASQVASSMLKTNPTTGPQYPWMRPVAASQSTASKVVAEREEERPRKRTKTVGADIGLGIRAWGSPAR